MERWRYMEEFENVALNGPLWPGDAISKEALGALENAQLFCRNGNGDVVLSSEGRNLWHLWSRVSEHFYRR